MRHKFLAFISRSNYKKSHSHQLDKFTPLSNRIREIYNVGIYFKAIEENPIPSLKLEVRDGIRGGKKRCILTADLYKQMSTLSIF